MCRLWFDQVHFHSRNTVFTKTPNTPVRCKSFINRSASFLCKKKTTTTLHRSVVKRKAARCWKIGMERRTDVYGSFSSWNNARYRKNGNTNPRNIRRAVERRSTEWLWYNEVSFWRKLEKNLSESVYQLSLSVPQVH